jgi:uncharacterized LabA/DUF88 family protein
MRVSAFIDGFNLYHAIDDLGRDDLKWINLRKLMQQFTEPKVHQLGHVYYFSAYCDWNREKRSRHMAFVRALRHFDVEPIMGNFKSNKQECHECGHEWEGHEEKQTDVNLAISLIQEAHRNTYDRAFVVTSDSDFVPALKLLNEFFPEKSIKVICPPERRHSKELVAHSKNPVKIQVCHLEACVMEPDVATRTGLVRRPAKYSPSGR